MCHSSRFWNYFCLEGVYDFLAEKGQTPDEKHKVAKSMKTVEVMPKDWGIQGGFHWRTVFKVFLEIGPGQ